MWYQRSIKEELIKKILDQIPPSWARRFDVQKYARMFVYGLETEMFSHYDPDLTRQGRNYVFAKIDVEKGRKLEKS